MWKIPLADLSFGPEEEAAVREVVASGWLTMGDRTALFEKRLGEALGTTRLLAVTNGTAALHLAYAGAGVGPGDEVICPSLTFVATANAALLCGANVVLADITGDDDLGIDPADVERKITKRTKAICVVHYAGHACDMDALSALADQHGIALIEDVAHGPMATHRDRALGTIGDVGAFSFFSNKNMTTGEGGAVIAKTQELYDRMKLMRSHGMTTLTLDRHRGHAFSYDVVLPGFNYRMDEMRSALGLVQLGRLREGNERRRALAQRYHRVLLDQPRVGVPYRNFEARTEAVSACHVMPILLPAGVDREGVMGRMKARGIQTSVHYPPIHRFSHHGSSDRVQTAGLSKTDAIAARELTLPLYPNMRDEQVDEVCAALAEAIGG